MLRLLNLSCRFCKDKSGSTAIEYGLIAALIFLGIVASINTFAGSMTGIYNKIDVAIVGAVSKQN